MDRDDTPAPPEEPEYAGIEFPDVPEFVQSFIDGLVEWLPMVTAVTKLCQSGDYGSMVSRVGPFQLIEELTHGATSAPCLVQLYGELHGAQRLFWCMPGSLQARQLATRSSAIPDSNSLTGR